MLGNISKRESSLQGSLDQRNGRDHKDRSKTLDRRTLLIQAAARVEGDNV